MRKPIHREFLQATSIEIGETDYLSKRETEAVYYIAQGCTAKVTGREMGGIAERTVNAFADNAMNKLNAMNRANLVAKAFSLGILRNSIKQRGSVAVSALWLMLSLTLSTLVLDGELIRARTRPSKARSSSYRVARGARAGRTGRRDQLAEVEPLDPFEAFGMED